MKVVYCSNSGHTQRYAEMLSKKLGLECISIKNYKPDDEKIIFLGWIFGSMVMGYNKLNKDNIICTAGVGMSFESKENTQNIIKVNNITGKFFYLQGGVDYTKLKGIKKLMLKMVGKSTIKKNREEDKQIIEVFKNGKDFVNESNLTQIIGYIKENNN